MEPMSEAESLELRQSSNWILQRQREQNEKDFALASFKRFDWHPWRGELVFSEGGIPRVVARIQVAGTWAAKAGTWTWAWANQALLPAVKQSVLRVRDFGEQRGVLALIQPRWAATESDAWQMTAIVGKMTDAKGAFKVPTADGAVFLVFSEIRKVGDRKRIFGARTCSHVLEEGRPILLVSREADGDVLAVCGGDDDTETTVRDLPLDTLLNLDSSLAELADLPDGWVALRESEDGPWTPSKPD